MPRFVDTNVLIYSSTGDPAEHIKRERARQVLSTDDLCLSTQVLQEFYAQVTRGSRPYRLEHGVAQGLVEAFMRFPVQDLTAAVVLAAIATCARFQISYWDAAIIAAARALGCDVVLTEDLNAGQDYGGVRVENPFASV